MFDTIKQLMLYVVHGTGVLVWTAILAYLLYIALYKYLWQGGLSSLSYHRWVLATDTTQRLDRYFLWSFLVGLVKLNSDNAACYHFRSYGGGYWRGRNDYACSFKDRIDNGEIVVPDKDQSDGIGEGVTAAVGA